MVAQWVYFRFGFLTATTNLLRDSDTTNSSKAIDRYILKSSEENLQADVFVF